MDLRPTSDPYTRLFDTMPDGAVVLDVSTFQIAYANKAAADMFGFASSREVIGENPLSYIPEEDRDEVARKIALNLEGKGNNPTEIRVITRDKRLLWVSANTTTIDYEGRTATLTTLRDITADKAKDAALRAAEDSKLRLIDAAAESIFVVQDGKMVYMNPAGAAVAGLSQKEMIGLSFHDFVHPDQREAVTERHEKLLAGQWFSDFTTVKGVDAKGETRWAEIREIPYSWQERPAVMSLVHDITDRVRAEEERKEREERLRAIIENAWDGITILDENYNVIFESPSLARISGYTPNEWLGRPVGQMAIHPDDLAPMLAKIEALKSQPGSVTRDVTIRYQHKDGSWRCIEATGRNLLHDPKVKGLVINFRDVTDRLKMQEELKNSEERFRTLIEKATDVVIVLDAAGKIIYQSPSLERVAGYGPNEWLDMSLDELFIHPDDLPSLASLLEQVLTQPGAILEGVTVRYKHKDGSWHLLEATVTNMLHDPKINGIVANFRDITDRKAAQEALAESEQKYRLLAEKMNDVVWMTDMSLRTTYVSPSVERILGFTPEERLKQDVKQQMTPESLARAAEALSEHQALEGDPKADPNRTLRIEMEYYRKDGSTVWLENQVSGIRDASGQLIGFHGVARDVTERRRVQEALKASETKYKDLFEHTLLGMEVLDGETGKVVLPNRSIARTFGFKSTADMVGTNPMDYVLPEDREWVATQMAELLTDPGWNKVATIRARTEDGRIIWVTAMTTPFNYEGRPSMLLSLIETTAAKESELKLRESEEKNRLLIDNAAEGIVVVQDGLLKFANPKCAEFTGRPAEELISTPFLDIIHPEDRLMMAENYSRRLAGDGIPNDYQFRIIDKQGNTKWLQINAVRFTWEDREATLSMLSDITERVKAEEALRDSEERFRGLVETSSDWVWEIDRNSRYTYVSPKVRDILGYDPQELLGRTPHEFMHQREGRRVARIVRRFAEAHLPYSLLENTCTHKDGRSVVLETSAVPILDSDGSFLGYRGISRDITERKKAEQEIQRSLKRLEKTMESTIEAITTTIETRDPYTTGHQMRVTDLACAIARVMELPPTQIEGIRVAGLLHDIGKIAIPTEILSKPGKLNEVEFSMIQTHAKVGYNILKKIEFAWPVAKAVLQHHERWNGSGYPHGIRGEDILLEARILAVADVMEAMASHRPYRPSVGLDKALDEITKNSGILYDPAVANACMTAFTRDSFKFASSVPGVVADSVSTSSDRPVHSQEDH